MADNHFVPENQLLVNEINVEKSDLVNHGERSLYSTSGEPQTHSYQQMTSGRVLSDAKESTSKDFPLEKTVKYLDCYKDAGTDDLTVPEIGGETSKETQQENINQYQNSKPLSRSLQKLESEEKQSRCHGEILEQKVAEVENVTKDAELTAEEPAKTDVATASTAVCDSESCKGIVNKGTTSYFQGPFQLSPFGVKPMESSQATIAGLGAGETINFATLVEGSDILYQKGQNPKDDTMINRDNVNQRGVTHHQQLPRSILRKEQVDNVAKPETKSVHFGFPVVWTKYFNPDDDNESTASTEILFSDEEFEDELQETDDQEVPRNDNLDEPCTKKARTDNGRFVPSFNFPEVMSIPSLDMLRFTDEGKDHNMTEVPNGSAEEISIRVDENERKVDKLQNSSPKDKQNHSASVEDNTTLTGNDGLADYGTSTQLQNIDLSKDERQHKDNTESQEKLQFLRKLVTSHHENYPDYGTSAGEPSCHKQQQELARAKSEDGPDCVKFAKISCHELVPINNEDGTDYVKFAEVPCHELLLIKNNDGPDYVKSAEEPCHELVQANSVSDYVKSAEIPCNELIPINNDDGPDCVRSAEVPCNELVQANSVSDYVKSAEIPCNELIPINNDDGPDCVRSAEVPCNELVPANNDDGPDYLKSAEVPCHDLVPANSTDYVRSAKVPCHELVPVNSDDSPDNIKSAEVSCLDKVPDANDLNQQAYTEMQEKPQLIKELVLATERNNGRYGQSDIVPCNDMVPDANDQYQHTDQEKPHCSELHVVPPADPETTPDKSFSSSPSSSEVSQNSVSHRDSLTESQPIQGGNSSLSSVLRVASFTSKGEQELPETVDSITCNRVNNYRPAGVCSSLLRLGEECLLDEVDNEPHVSPDNILGKPWMDHFLDYEGPSLYQDDRGSFDVDFSLSDNDITQKLETPSLSPVRNPLVKTSFEEEFSSCDNENESCSSQISEITEEVKNLLTMNSSACEPRPRPESTVFTNIENQDLGIVPEEIKYRTRSLSALEREACSLDGPELLEMAMHLVESAIRKTKCPNRRLEQCPIPVSSAESNKTSLTRVKVTPAFTWKKFSYESQQATLNLDNQDKNESNQGVENGNLNHKKLYYNKSCTRPLRVGLSRRSHNHSLHPYVARPRSGNTMENEYQEVPDYNSSE